MDQGKEVKPNGKSARAKSSKKLVSTGTKGEKAARNTNSNNKLFAGIGACLFLAAAVGVFVYVMLSTSPTDCEKYLKEKASGKKITLGLDPISSAECMETTCGFDFSKCKMPCPFGYEKDERTICTISCECAVKGSYQGDVSFDERVLPEMLTEYGHVKEKKEDFSLFFGWRHNIWNNIEIDGRFKIPYEMDSSASSESLEEWEISIRNISERTCLDYITRKGEKDYIRISVLSVDCSSKIGRVTGIQSVALNSYGCFFESTIQHELMHSMGFKHEQSRPDRDAYVDIFYDNIDDHYKHNFQKIIAHAYTDLNSEYDLGSGMHYQSFFFAKNKRKPTLLKKGGGTIFYWPKTQFLTAEDFKEINLLYECPETGEKKTGEWGEWGGWSGCGQSCGNGRRIRYRRCMNGEDVLTTGCDGLQMSTENCNTEECPPKNGTFLQWGKWGKCSATCGKGMKLRSRECSEVLQCEGYYFDRRRCYESFCNNTEITTYTFGTWSQWAAGEDCTVTCGTGTKTQVRQCWHKKERLPHSRCNTDNLAYGVNEDGNVKVLDCNVQPCDVFPSSSSSSSSSTSEPSSPAGPDPTSQPGPTSGPDPESEPGSVSPIESGGDGMLKGTPGNKLSGICTYGHIFVGRFDDDEVPDLACIYSDGFLRLYLTDPQKGIFGERISWEGKTELCAYNLWIEAYNVHVVDMNRDNLDDLVCDDTNARHSQAILNLGGKFPEKDLKWRGIRSRCNWLSLYHDVDDDGKPDWICGDQGNVVEYVYFGTNDSNVEPGSQASPSLVL